MRDEFGPKIKVEIWKLSTLISKVFVLGVNIGVFREVAKSYFESSTPSTSISTSWGIFFKSELVVNSSKITYMFGYFWAICAKKIELKMMGSKHPHCLKFLFSSLAPYFSPGTNLLTNIQILFRTKMRYRILYKICQTYCRGAPASDIWLR
jgi:hypothetical protein